MPAVRHLALAALCLLALAGLSACGKPKEQVMAQCLQMIEEKLATDKSLLTRALNKEGYCTCLVESKGSKDHTETARQCMTANSRDGFINLCNAELAPEVAKAARQTLDCGCFYDRSTGEALKLAQGGQASISPQQEQDIALKALQACSR